MAAHRLRRMELVTTMRELRDMPPPPDKGSQPPPAAAPAGCKPMDQAKFSLMMILQYAGPGPGGQQTAQRSSASRMASALFLARSGAPSHGKGRVWAPASTGRR